MVSIMKLKIAKKRKYEMIFSSYSSFLRISGVSTVLRIMTYAFLYPKKLLSSIESFRFFTKLLRVSPKTIK